MKNKPQPRRFRDRRQFKPKSAPVRRTRIQPSLHAAQRYVERVEGNITIEAATQRLLKLLGKARYAGERPGHAAEYRVGRLSLIVADELVLTVYRSPR